MDKMKPLQRTPDAPTGKGKLLPRRTFLKGTAAASTAALVTGQSASEIVRDLFFLESTERDLDSYISLLKTTYGVDVVFNDVDADVGNGNTLTKSEQLDFVKAVQEAIALYPPSYIASAGLKTIHAVKDLKMKGTKDPTMTITGYVATKNPDTLVISKEDIVSFFQDKFGWDNSKRVQAVFHHELYHMTDGHLHDQKFNEEWVKESAKHGANPRTVSFSDVFSIRQEGFASTYGKLGGAKEDRAEVAAALFADAEKMEKLAETEPALKVKLEVVKKDILTRSNGLMDGPFWEFLKKGKMEQAKRYVTLQEKFAKK